MRPQLNSSNEEKNFAREQFYFLRGRYAKSRDNHLGNL
jgi:hypothetical protein